jgi:hypothetical protein
VGAAGICFASFESNALETIPTLYRAIGEM